MKKVQFTRHPITNQVKQVECTEDNSQSKKQFINESSKVDQNIAEQNQLVNIKYAVIFVPKEEFISITKSLHNISSGNDGLRQSKSAKETPRLIGHLEGAIPTVALNYSFNPK